MDFTRTNILCPGRSVLGAQYKRKGWTTVAVNAAVTHPRGCEVWSCIEGLHRKWWDQCRYYSHGEPKEIWSINGPAMTMPKNAWAKTTGKFVGLPGSLESYEQSFPWALPWPKGTINWTIGAVLARGAKEILLWGCDLNGTNSWNPGRQEPISNERTAEWWLERQEKERAWMEALAAGLKTRGIKLERVIPKDLPLQSAGGHR